MLLIVIGWVLKFVLIGIFVLVYGVGVWIGMVVFGVLVYYIVCVLVIGVVVLFVVYLVGMIGGWVWFGWFVCVVVLV